MNDDLISVLDAAKKLRIHKQTLFRWIQKHGIRTIKQKHSDHKGQAICYITNTDFDLIIKHHPMNQNEEQSTEATSSKTIDHGVFYLIQLEPDHDPGRFKLGFTSSMPERLSDHRCSAPYAVTLDTWPCHALWKKTVIDCVTQGCEKLHTEVFRTDDIKKIMEKCDKFFSLMPPLDNILR